MAIANRCKCKAVQLDNPKSIKENPFYLNCKTGEMLCKACYKKEVPWRERFNNWVFTAGFRAQHKIIKKIEQLSKRFTAFRVRMVWGPQQ